LALESILLFASTAGIIVLWFLNVRRVMREKRNMLESAASQLSGFRLQANGSPFDPELAALLSRSESIYCQAHDLYQKELKKPWIFPPAALMGFCRLPTPDDAPPACAETALSNTFRKERYWGSVRFFKNMILLLVAVMIAVPSAMSVYFAANFNRSEAALREQLQYSAALAQENVTLQQALAQQAEPTAEAIESFLLSAESPYAHLYPDFYAPEHSPATVRRAKTVHLTFDDGPSECTDAILDVLQEKNVKATFFVIGSETPEQLALLQRIADEGHTLAMHSYSHRYGEIYASVEAYLADMYRIFTQIKDTTGQAPTLFRFPGGSINGYNSAIYQELIAEMLRRGFIPHDWNISSEDASAQRLLSAKVIEENVIAGAQKVTRGIVLMHDSASKTTTVDALAPTIDRLLELGFAIEPLQAEDAPVLYSYRE